MHKHVLNLHLKNCNLFVWARNMCWYYRLTGVHCLLVRNDTSSLLDSMKQYSLSSMDNVGMYLCVCHTLIHWACARITLFVSPAASELHQLNVKLIENRPIQRADSVYQLETERQRETRFVGPIRRNDLQSCNLHLNHITDSIMSEPATNHLSEGEAGVTFVY